MVMSADARDSVSADAYEVGQNSSCRCSRDKTVWSHVCLHCDHEHHQRKKSSSILLMRVLRWSCCLLRHLVHRDAWTKRYDLTDIRAGHRTRSFAFLGVAGLDECAGVVQSQCRLVQV